MYQRNSCPLVAFSAALSAVALAVPAQCGVISQSSDIPPVLGRFTAEPQVTLGFGFVVVELDNIQFTVLNDPAPMRTVVGMDENVAFHATLTADFLAFDDAGQSEEGHVTFSGTAEMLVSEKAGQEVGTFQTEIVSMNLLPEDPSVFGFFGSLSLEESPTQSSLGLTTVLPYQPPVPPPPPFEIDSTMDLFVTTPGLVNEPSIPLTLTAIVPEPHSLSLVAAAAIVFLIHSKVRRHRRRLLREVPSVGAG